MQVVNVGEHQLLLLSLSCSRRAKVCKRQKNKEQKNRSKKQEEYLPQEFLTVAHRDIASNLMNFPASYLGAPLQREEDKNENQWKLNQASLIAQREKECKASKAKNLKR